MLVTITDDAVVFFFFGGLISPDICSGTDDIMMTFFCFGRRGSAGLLKLRINEKNSLFAEDMK